MYRSHEVGVNGEDIASEFLTQKGYEIFYRNFKCKLGEIDIIAKDKDEIIFFEVKTRTQQNYGMPAESVDKNKKTHIYRVAEYFVMKNSLENELMRFDVIEIYIRNNGNYNISHIKNAILDKPKVVIDEE